MANYSYSARNEAGKLIQATIVAEDERDLINKVGNLGFFLISSKVIANINNSARGFTRLTLKQVLDFTLDLATMLNAGVSLIDSLRDLARDAENKEIGKVITNIRQRVESGNSLKDSLSYHSRSFPVLYLSIVGAGESTGKLSLCLSNLFTLIEWQLELKAKIKEAAVYPVILFVVMTGVVMILMLKVIPTFETIFKDVGANLPPLTQVVLNISHFLRRFWYLILGNIFLVVTAYKVCNSTLKGRLILDRTKIKLPVFGSLLHKIALSRFCHTFSLALGSGINVLSALDISGGVIGNSYLENAVKKARELVNVGEKLANAFQVSNCFPPLVVRMITVGEQTGALPQSLERVNQFYDREVPATIRKMFALFEPLMIIIMGVVVGGIALSIFLPMFKMADLIVK